MLRQCSYIQDILRDGGRGGEGHIGMLSTASSIVVLSLLLLILVGEQEYQLEIFLGEAHFIHLCLSALQSLRVGING